MCIATPLGLVVGALAPRAVDVSVRQNGAHGLAALISTYTIIAVIAALTVGAVMRTATCMLAAAAKQAAAEAYMTMSHDGGESASASIAASRVVADLESGGALDSCRTQPAPSTGAASIDARDAVGHIDETKKGEVASGGYAGHQTDVLPQIAKLASSAEFLSIAATFACTIAPLQLVFGLQDLLLPRGVFAQTLQSGMIAVGTIVASALLQLYTQALHVAISPQARL